MPSAGASKKTPVARERDRADVEAARQAFKARQPSLTTAKLVFVDESGFRLGASPRYGWAPVGVKAPGKTVCGRWQSMTMVGAIALDGFRAFFTIDAPTSGDVFAAFVTTQLAPQLHAGDLVVMDNLGAHKRQDIITAIRAVGADVLFLPPYSPEFNPIEQVWGKLKDIVRRMATLTREAFDCAVAIAMDAISLEDIRGWTAHAGYIMST
jgi:transposase